MFGFKYYRTEGGVHIHDDQLTVTSPTIMWVKAMDLLLDRLKTKKLDFSKVAALSGTGQVSVGIYYHLFCKKHYFITSL